MKCRFCKRTLKVPFSIRVGFGPVCGKKHGLFVNVTVEQRQVVEYEKVEVFF